MTMAMMNRRTALLSAAAFGLAWTQRAAAAPIMTVHKDPTCGCCGAWVDHVTAAGYRTTVIETSNINALKASLGVPASLRSCHTAEIEGYVLEGHVPAQAIGRLLAERPRAKGLAVPGMLSGTPGMEVAGAAPQTYDVMLFGDGEPVPFMRFMGAAPV